jgi:hypothetical protein
MKVFSYIELQIYIHAYRYILGFYIWTMGFITLESSVSVWSARLAIGNFLKLKTGFLQRTNFAIFPYEFASDLHFVPLLYV